MHSTRSAGWTVLIITVHLHNLVLIASLVLSICHVGLPALARIGPTGTVDSIGSFRTVMQRLRAHGSPSTVQYYATVQYNIRKPAGLELVPS